MSQPEQPPQPHSFRYLLAQAAAQNSCKNVTEGTKEERRQKRRDAKRKRNSKSDASGSGDTVVVDVTGTATASEPAAKRARSSTPIRHTDNESGAEVLIQEPAVATHTEVNPVSVM